MSETDSGQNSAESGIELDRHCQLLIERAHAGDETAQGELLQLYREKLIKMVSVRMDPRIVKRVDASDVVQDATLEAAKRLKSFLAAPTMDFYLWLRWITRDRLADVHRLHLGSLKRAVSREVSVNEPHVDHSTLALADALVGELTSPSNAMDRKLNRTAVREAISRLNEKEQEILMLRHFEQLSTDQAAAVLDMSRSGVCKRHVQALRKLKSALHTSLPNHE